MKSTKLYTAMDAAISSVNEATTAWAAVYYAIGDAVDTDDIDVKAWELARELAWLAIDASKNATWFVEDAYDMAQEQNNKED